MKTAVIGRGYSKRVKYRPETFADLVEALRLNPIERVSIGELAGHCERDAVDYLKRRGLPINGESELLRSKDGGRVGLEEYFAERYGVDSVPHIAARIIRLAALLRIDASAGRHAEAVEGAFELGRLVTLAEVYSRVDKAGGRGGKTKPVTPWAAYAAHLVRRHPGATKKEIWRSIPEGSMAARFTTAGAEWQIYREDEKLFAGGPERDIELSRKRFCDSYLRTR